MAHIPSSWKSWPLVVIAASQQAVRNKSILTDNMVGLDTRKTMFLNVYSIHDGKILLYSFTEFNTNLRSTQRWFVFLYFIVKRLVSATCVISMEFYILEESILVL